MGSALRKRSRPYQAKGHGQVVPAAPGVVLPPAPGAGAWVTAVRRDPNAVQILVAVAGLLAGAGAAWIVSNAGPVRASFSNVPFALPVAVLVG